MSRIQKKLNRSEKILTSLFKFSNGSKKKFSYEDIVVELFKTYPNEFHLKGYPDYPDASDSTQRILYKYKKDGYVNAENKIFSLSNHGVELAKILLNNSLKEGHARHISNRLSRATLIEIERIKNLEGFNLYINGERDNHTDSDFYKYIGVTAKTSETAFTGRVNVLKSIIKELAPKHMQAKYTLYTQIVDYHNFVFSKYAKLINYFLKQ